MGKLKKVASEARQVARFLITGDTTSAANRRSLNNYQRYQADERKREQQEDH